MAILLLLLMLSSLAIVFVPPAAAASAGGSSSSSASNSPNTDVISKGTSPNYAWYEIYSPSPGKVISVQADWNVPSVTCTAEGSVQVTLEVTHIVADDSGSFLVVECSGPGAQPTYSLTYDGNGYHANPLPAGDTVSAGDKMYTRAEVDTLGGETSIAIQDLTKGWSFGTGGSETINTGESAGVYWAVASANSGTTGMPLPQFTTVRFSNAQATIDGHSGYIGTFISGFTVYKYNWRDSGTGHILAKPTSISSTSTGFKIKWVQGS